mmetsp:Transcript_9852/g.16875  ORF Transcript_9852/g.16875 Transcript_9852/m.16875 type:complete len:274 (+) Transcript_9852:1237-2058(+)
MHGPRRCVDHDHVAHRPPRLRPRLDLVSPRPRHLLRLRGHRHRRRLPTPDHLLRGMARPRRLPRGQGARRLLLPRPRALRPGVRDHRVLRHVPDAARPQRQVLRALPAQQGGQGVHPARVRDVHGHLRVAGLDAAAGLRPPLVRQRRRDAPADLPGGGRLLPHRRRARHDHDAAHGHVRLHERGGAAGGRAARHQRRGEQVHPARLGGRVVPHLPRLGGRVLHDGEHPGRPARLLHHHLLRRGGGEAAGGGGGGGGSCGRCRTSVRLAYTRVC